MGETVRRGFVNHHIAGTTKIVILVVAAYPFIDVAFGKSNLHSPFAGSKVITQGDILLVASQMLIAMYVFELFYRTKISPVSVGHHIGTILIGQSAIAIGLSIAREPDAAIEFILCTVWGISAIEPLDYPAANKCSGAFDIVSEFLPHVSIILYRVYPTKHYFLKRLFFTCMVTTFCGTMAETVLTMYLFGISWNRWQLAFKITTPMLHVLFMSCQLWGTYNFYKMVQRQKRIIRDQEREQGKHEDTELGTKKMEESKASHETIVAVQETLADGLDNDQSSRESGLSRSLRRRSESTMVLIK